MPTSNPTAPSPIAASSGTADTHRLRRAGRTMDQNSRFFAPFVPTVVD